MTRVVLQPAGSRDAQRHYRDTIESPIALSRIQPHISSSVLETLRETVTGDGVCVWGVTPSSESKWNRIQNGDTVLFAGNGRFFSASKVIAKTHSWPLANELWDSDATGERWEFLYFITSPTSLDMPYEKFNVAVGYKPNYFPRGFSVLDFNKSRLALDFLEFEGAEAEYESAYRAIDAQASLDAVTTVMVRREQSALRRVLVGTTTEEECGICGRMLPVSLLVAAHIKQRSECTQVEKADIPFIAMPICTLGCDALYEAGWVTVDDGVVKTARTASPALSDVLGGLSGTKCTYWVPARESYFRWHRGNRFKD